MLQVFPVTRYCISSRPIFLVAPCHVQLVRKNILDWTMKQLVDGHLDMPPDITPHRTAVRSRHKLNNGQNCG